MTNGEPRPSLFISASLFAHSVLHGEDAAGSAAKKPARAMKIQIRIGEKKLTATMRDSATTVDFLSLLPLKLTLKDYARTEKIADLPEKLTTHGAPAGSEPSAGDIAYYAPWGNLALFYKDFGDSSGLIILEKLDSRIEVLTKFGAGNIIIERTDSHE